MPTYEDMPKADVTVNLNDGQGRLELWRHSFGAGGVNPRPLPPGVINGLAKLRPRLIRIFIQQFFNIYPEHDQYDWAKLDAYMDALENTGAKIVASITIKPPPLFPAIDAAIWRPSDVKEWQQVIAALVQRYSVERRLVTYWEIGNEPDIGENGGCPYLIADPEDYAQYYAMTIKPILATFPKAKVGGLGAAYADGALLSGFMDICRRDGLQLDFISWHLYNDDPARHASYVEKYNQLLTAFGENPPETLITEWNILFDRVSLEELAYDPARPAAAAASILAMTDAKVSWTFYYHTWDQVAYHGDFEAFFKNPDIMYNHWNQSPHRFGLFSVEQEVRPQYFVYQMLGQMLEHRVSARSECNDIRVLASRLQDSCAILLVNYSTAESEDRVISLQLRGLTPGLRKLTVFRIEGRHGWSAEKLELQPVEQREVDVRDAFSFQTYSPANSVSLVKLEPMARV